MKKLILVFAIGLMSLLSYSQNTYKIIDKKIISVDTITSCINTIVITVLILDDIKTDIVLNKREIPIYNPLSSTDIDNAVKTWIAQLNYEKSKESILKTVICPMDACREDVCRWYEKWK